ncbi:hypothetical protein [Streptomyces sp. GSL17-111]|uniref:hypothetical protein n=1 Tax=Streptomyces sp. GSL17-111 TaxID=3121596 RepID=UPI0030F416CB
MSRHRRPRGAGPAFVVGAAVVLVLAGVLTASLWPDARPADSAVPSAVDTYPQPGGGDPATSDVSDPAAPSPQPPAASEPDSSASPSPSAATTAPDGTEPRTEGEAETEAAPTPREAEPPGVQAADSSDHAAVLEATSRRAGVWVTVGVTNHGGESATYEIAVAVTGPDGYRAEGTYHFDALAPGASTSAGRQLVDGGGPGVPDDPDVTLVSVTRLPS